MALHCVQKMRLQLNCADVAADVTHPVLGESIADLLARLAIEPGDVYPVADDWIEAP